MKMNKYEEQIKENEIQIEQIKVELNILYGSVDPLIGKVEKLRREMYALVTQNNAIRANKKLSS